MCFIRVDKTAICSIILILWFGCRPIGSIRMQTVGVKGNFTCGEAPAKFFRLEIICGSLKEVIRTGQTDESGLFSLAGRKRTSRGADMTHLYLRVYPKCFQEQECKDTRMEFSIPEVFVYPKKKPYRVHDIGTFDLAQTLPKIYTCEDSNNCKKLKKINEEYCKRSFIMV